MSSQEQMLDLAERANDIYRQQLKYMQDHLASLRSVIEDKDNIMQNLKLRYNSNKIDPEWADTELTASTQKEIAQKAKATVREIVAENLQIYHDVNGLWEKLSIIPQQNISFEQLKCVENEQQRHSTDIDDSGNDKNEIFESIDDADKNDMDRSILSDDEHGEYNKKNSSELSISEKLELAEKANENYREELKYMQDHLRSLRQTIQRKELNIERLMVNYDGEIVEDTKWDKYDDDEKEAIRAELRALVQEAITTNIQLIELQNIQQRHHLIIFGFVTMNEKLIRSDNNDNSYYNIPKLVNELILCYYTKWIQFTNIELSTKGFE